MKKFAIAPIVLAGGIVLTAHSSALAASSTDIVQTGEQYIGKPYVYGALVGNLNEFDCSSFTATVFKQNGIILPRVAADQAKVGTAVQKADLQVGDLVFFDTSFNGVIDHVGIYIGNNQMLNAILSGVKITNMNSSYWTSRYVTARRVLNTPISLEQIVQSANPTTQVTPIPNATPTTTSNPSSNVSSSAVHTVQSGDSLWLISQKYGISVAELKTINKLTADIIFPGEQIKVRLQTVTTTQTTKSSTSKAAVQPVPTQNVSPSTYTVVSGDTLSKIGQKFNLTVAQLKSLNQLGSDLIFPGHSLSLRNSTSSAKPTPVAQKSSAPSAPATILSTQTTATTTTYTVKKGDTLSAIAHTEGVSLSNLMSLNHLTSYIIYPGQKLKTSQTRVPSTDSQVKMASVKAPKTLSYTVKKGDTLWDIALLNDTNTKKLMKANNLSSPYIFPGQKINII